MTDSSTAWVMANWARVVGLPTPDADAWMLRDTPLTRSTLDCLKSNALVEREGNEYRSPSQTRRETHQMTYSTKRLNSVFDKIDEYTDLSRETAKAFAADPTVDVYVVEVFARPESPVARDVPRLAEELDLDVQIIGVGVEEPAEYPGEFIEAPKEELMNPTSRTWRMIPGDPDVLCLSPDEVDTGVVVDILESDAIGEPQLLPIQPQTLDPWFNRLLVDTGDDDASGDGGEDMDENQMVLGAFDDVGERRARSKAGEAVASDEGMRHTVAGQASLTEF